MRFWLACCLFALLPLQWVEAAPAAPATGPSAHETQPGARAEAGAVSVLAAKAHCGLAGEPTCADCPVSCCAVRGKAVHMSIVPAAAARWLPASDSERTPPWPARPERPKWPANATPDAAA
jgi:hypothetical protein